MSPPATNSLIFCLSANIFISPSFLKNSLAICRILGWVFFSLWVFWAYYPITFLSPLSVLRRQLLILLWLTLQMTSCSSLAVLKSFPCLSAFLMIHLFVNLLHVSYLKFLELPGEVGWHIWISRNFSALISSMRLLLSPLLSFWFSHHAYVSVLNRDPHFSEVLFIFLHFSLCSLDYIISIDLFSACSNLLLSPTSKFFISAVFVNSRISIWFLYFKISFINTIYLMWHHYHIL